MPSWVYYDYECPKCGVFDSMEARPAPRTVECSCGKKATRCLSPTAIKTPWGYVTQGKSDPRPPGTLDTRPLADGTPYSKWAKRKRATS